MPKGWKQAYKGHEGPPDVDFVCPSHGSFRPAVQAITLVKKRYLQGEQNFYMAACPECGSVCKHFLNELPPEPASKKPTKVMKKHGQTIKIHGRCRMVFPADLEEVLAEEQRIRKEKEQDG